jgi:hypothetical protein
MHLLRQKLRGEGTQPRRRPSYANVASTLALIVAVGGGTAFAASHHYIITSTKQIKPKVLRTLHGKNGKNGKDGNNGKKGTNGTNGVTGPTGPTGATGATGPAAVPNAVTGTATNVTLSAIRGLVASAIAPSTAKDLVIAQVAAHRATPQSPGDSIGCVLNDLTAAPGTDYSPANATFPVATGFSSFVAVPLQAVIPANAGDIVAVSCVGGSAGFAVDSATITVIPLK